METLTPKQIAAELNVANVTVYKWIQSGKLRSIEQPEQFVHRRVVDRVDFERFKADRQAERHPHKLDRERDPVHVREWADRYYNRFNSMPPLWHPYVKGLVAFEDMVDHVRRTLTDALGEL